MEVGDAHVFPGFLRPELIQLFFPKPLTTFLTCFCRGERRKNARKKVTDYNDFFICKHINFNSEKDALCRLCGKRRNIGYYFFFCRKLVCPLQQGVSVHYSNLLIVNLYHTILSFYDPVLMSKPP